MVRNFVRKLSGIGNRSVVTLKPPEYTSFKIKPTEKKSHQQKQAADTQRSDDRLVLVPSVKENNCPGEELSEVQTNIIIQRILLRYDRAVKLLSEHIQYCSSFFKRICHTLFASLGINRDLVALPPEREDLTDELKPMKTDREEAEKLDIN